MAQYLPSTSSLNLCYILVLDRIRVMPSVPLARQGSWHYISEEKEVARLLMSWTLVCRAWVQPCREYLLGDVNLVRADQAETFLELLRSPHCTMRPFITSLRINPPGYDGSWATTTVWDLAKLKLPFRDLKNVLLKYRNCISVDIARNLSKPLQYICDLSIVIQNPDEFSHVAHLLTALPRMTKLSLAFEPDDVPDWLVEDSSWKELLPPQSLEKLTICDSSTPLILDWFTSHVPENVPKNLSDLSLHHLRNEDTHLVSSLLQTLGPVVKNLLLQSSDHLRSYKAVRPSESIGISLNISLSLPFPMLTFIILQQRLVQESIDLSRNTSLNSLQLCDTVSLTWVLPSLMEMDHSSLGSVIVECDEDYDETALRRLDRAVQGSQYRNLEKVEVFAYDADEEKIGKMLARSRARGILVLKT